jgi:hypothetical protein
MMDQLCFSETVPDALRAACRMMWRAWWQSAAWMASEMETEGPGRCQIALRKLHGRKPRLGAALGADDWAMAMLGGGVTEEI